MRTCSSFAIALGLAFSAAVIAQQPNVPPSGQGQGEGGQRGGRGWVGGMMGMGRGTIGAVTEVAADHYTIKTETGEIYTVHFSANTRILKQVSGPNGSHGQERGMGTGNGGNPPQAIKASDIKPGDVIVANGEVDEGAKSVGALFVVQLDPERAKQMKEIQASFGKTWLMGRVTAINEAKVTLQSPVDSATHAFVADENTSFRRRRDPITLADVEVGDNVRVEGSIKGGVFVATTVNVGMPPANGGPAQRHAEPGR